MFYRRQRLLLGVLAIISAAPSFLRANAILDPTAPAGLTLYSLGTVAGVDTRFGTYEGVAFNGTNDLLLSVSNASTNLQTIWSLPLLRSDNHVVGFGSATVYANVLSYPTDCGCGNVVAGGLAVSGGGLLYTTAANSYLGELNGSSNT